MRINMKKVSVGIDIGGTNTAFGIVDESGNVLIKDSISTPLHGDITLFIDQLSIGVQDFLLFVSLQKEENIECSFHNLKLNYKVRLNKLLLRVMLTANVGQESAFLVQFVPLFRFPRKGYELGNIFGRILSFFCRNTKG